jgi:thiosulfate reductase cytochrome b subunit
VSATQSSTRRVSRKLVVSILVAIVGLAVLVLAARALRELPAVQEWITRYPGETELPDWAPVGLPVWLNWQHFLSSLFLLLIIRTGWQVRTAKRPAGHWTRNNTGLIRTKNPPKKITLELWLHLALDVLLVVNGVVFLVLSFATGHWVRIVPTTWEVVPNAASALLQYLSLNWPTENGWVNYNSLQQLSYFAIIFIVTPLAIITGLRMSGAWPAGATRLNRAFPIEWARAVHFPVMLVFVAFIVMHVALVLSTGALRNLNHMYAARDDGSWVGFGIFAASLAVMVGAWFAARPVLIRPVAALTGKVSR